MAMGAFLFVDDHKEREMINGKYSYRIRPRNETEVERFRAFLERHGALERALQHVELKPRLYEVSFDLDVRYLEMVGWCSHTFYPANREFVEDLDGFIAWYEGQGERAPKKNDLVGLVIDKGDEAELLRICKRYAIDTPYPGIFEDGKYHPMWALNAKGIGLAGTEVMRRLRKVLHGLGELADYLSSLGNGPTPAYEPQGQPIVVRAENEDELHAIIAALRRDFGFRCDRPIAEGGIKGPFAGGCPWIFANVEGRSYWVGKAGVCYYRPVFNRWIKPEDFLTILRIVYGSKKIEEGRP